MKSATTFLEERLKLTVNREKSEKGSPHETNKREWGKLI